MAEADDVKVQIDEDDKAAAGTMQEKAFAARRRFLRQALAVTSSTDLPHSTFAIVSTSSM